MEEWKVIDGYSGKYSISNHGRVMNIKRGRIMNTHKNQDGYLRLSLLHEGVYFHAVVHRLVALYFVPNPGKKNVVNHIDGNKENNHYTNVEWVTASENNKHAIHVLGHQTWIHKNTPTKGKFGKDARDHKVIEQYDKSGEYIATHYGTNQASRDTGVCVASISRCCTGKAKTAGGYIWKFKIAA